MRDYIEAHKYSSNHKKELLQDKSCGCFYCLAIFNPKSITSWIPDTSGTALCPFCGIDSIIGESSKYPIVEKFLKKMYMHWFEGSKDYGFTITKNGYSLIGKKYGVKNLYVLRHPKKDKPIYYIKRAEKEG